MAVAAVLATALNSGRVRSKTLTLNGLDLVLQPDVLGNAYGVPIESVHVQEQGPGGVSSMTFTIEDPGIGMAVAEGQVVEFWDVAKDAPIFKGFVQSWAYNVFGTGRTIDVRCVGLDVLLDWMIIPALTVPIGTRLDTGVQMCVAAAVGVGYPLNTSISPGVFQGTQAQPIGDQANAMLYDVVVDGKTLREAIQAVINAPALGALPSRSLFWVDFYGGLRLFYDLQVGARPSDYADQVIQDVYGGPAGDPTTYEVDAAGVAHSVYVLGGNALGSGVVTDGSNLPGPVAILNDATSITTDIRDAIGIGYLLEHAAAARASARLSDIASLLASGSTFHGSVRAGGRIYVTDAQFGLLGAPFRIMSIDKDFNPAGTETWVFQFGGYAKSVLRQTRHLTRNELS